MSRRRLAFASIAVVIVLCVIGVSIVAVAAGGSALAYEVNGSRTSQETVDDQLDGLADHRRHQERVALAGHGRLDHHGAGC